MTFNLPVPPAFQLPTDRFAPHIESHRKEMLRKLSCCETNGRENCSPPCWKTLADFGEIAVGGIPACVGNAVPPGSCEGETPHACWERRLRGQPRIGSKQEL